jgi:hypothetical protein
VVKTESETEKAKVVNEAPCSIREQTTKMCDTLEKMFATMETAFGRATVEEIVEGMCSRATEKSLAKLGKLLTPENYIAELRFNEVLDSTIERAHDRLLKYQASRATKSTANVKSLQPDWVARKR